MEIRELFLDNLKSLYSSIKYCVKIGKGHIDPIESFLTLSGPGFEKLAQTGGADSAPPLNSAPLYPN